ncbi:unnamed protein product [Acanthoscelides obtectus]|nr:unnamed protein product [Acanthoscelides obtectus]CAK1632123.1 hypothetical protein AOBTE_LOCUS7377 [Acanthoscelides obtectus]
MHSQRSVDSRASISSLWSSELSASSRRDSEAIPEHEVDSTTTDSRATCNGRRYSDTASNKRRRSSARLAAQIRRYVRRAPPFSHDRRRTTGRLV